jgi:hypothetical protein
MIDKYGAFFYTPRPHESLPPTFSLGLEYFRQGVRCAAHGAGEA